MTWRDLLAGGGARREAEGAARQSAARRSEKIERAAAALAGTVKEIQESVARIADDLRTLHVQVEQLSAVQEADGSLPARLAQLEPTLDAALVASHLADAFRRAELSLAPIPHLLVRDCLPADLYEALVDAIPAPSLFDGERSRPEVVLPPVFAPVHAIVTWSFMSDVLRNTLGPAVVDRFDDGLRGRGVPGWPALEEHGMRLAVSRGRLVLRRPGDVVPRDSGRASHVLAGIVALDPRTGGAGTGGGTGASTAVWLRGRASAGADTVSPDVATTSTTAVTPPAVTPARTMLLLPRNSALAFLTTAGVLEFPPGSTAAGDNGRGERLCTYEFTIGPSNRPRGERRRQPPA